ncbi:MAG: T9SS type A sorting domain-containing protein [Ignavibacteriae bacterium]|nr:T9SS type A sorting domain-containing protein [Ignavibacteriota bacterium]
MKKLILNFILIFTVNCFSQVDTTFFGLRGYEDLNGNTQLFYRMKSNYSYQRSDEFWAGENRQDIFHFDVKKNLDSLFLMDGGDYYEPFPSTGHVVSDFEFIDSTLTNFYQAGDAITSFEPGPIVIYNRNYDSPFQVQSFHGVTHNLEIANFDSSYKVYVYADNSPKGIFSQISDDYFELVESTENFKLVSISKKNPNLWFVEDQKGFLYKSIDTGKTFYLADSVYNANELYQQDYINYSFINDLDNIHIYRIIINDNKYKLVVSNNLGELGSWNEVFESTNEISITCDNSLSGAIYIAADKQIYISSDYGNTFSKFKELKATISGIYKRPNSDLLYITTPYKLLELNSDSVRIMKQLTDYNSLNFYPLQIGDKWYYEIIYNPVWETGGQHLYYLTKEVKSDTTLNNGKKYFTIKETRSDSSKVKIYYERIDSINGKVYKLDDEINNSEEFLITNLYSNVGDTFQTFIKINNFYEMEDVSFSEEKFQSIFENNSIQEITKNYLISSDGPFNFFEYSYAKNFGKTYQHKGHFESYDEYQNLIAAFINGKKFGDTTLVGVKENLTNLPTEFYLSQNYPNPFNPTTTIEYSVPEPSVISNPQRGERSQNSNSIEIFPVGRNNNNNISLKVFDILGREVATLVNQKQKPGNYKIEFDASPLSSGIYLYQLKSGAFIQTKKMIVLK